VFILYVLGQQQTLTDMLELAPSAGPVFLDLSMDMNMNMGKSWSFLQLNDSQKLLNK
jgi:hypothetical protein